VQARHARLGQLRLAIRHFLQLVPPSHISLPPTLPLLIPSPNSTPNNVTPLATPWASLASLTAQTLLAHVSSLPDTDTASAARLSHALQQLTAQIAALTGSIGRSSSNARTAFSEAVAAAQEVASVLAQSNHALLRSLMQPLLLPALEALVQGAAAAAAATAATTQQQQQQQQQQHKHQQGGAVLVAQGRCWVLLGEARLQLLVPPPGACVSICMHPYLHAHVCVCVFVCSCLHVNVYNVRLGSYSG